MKTRPDQDSAARRRIFTAAVRVFANRGYAAASIQEIVRRARVTKPTLYYYYGSKAGLYQNLVKHAQDQWCSLIRKAAAQNRSLEGRLEGILRTLFQFAHAHRELMRLCYASAFAAPGEVPNQSVCHKRGGRSFELILNLVKQAQRAGELNRRFDPLTVGAAFFGQILINTISPLFDSPHRLTRATARRLVKLYLHGAASTRQ